jgi:hypothetical protein
MAQRRLTIDLPSSAEALHNVLQTLMHYGLISEKKVRTIVQAEKARKPGEKSRWALTAEEMSKENLLDNGLGEELRNYIHEFREGFAFKDSFDSKEG